MYLTWSAMTNEPGMFCLLELFLFNQYCNFYFFQRWSFCENRLCVSKKDIRYDFTHMEYKKQTKEQQTHRGRQQMSGYQRARSGRAKWVNGQLYGDGWKLDFWW